MRICLHIYRYASLETYMHIRYCVPQEVAVTLEVAHLPWIWATGLEGRQILSGRRETAVLTSQWSVLERPDLADIARDMPMLTN